MKERREFIRSMKERRRFIRISDKSHISYRVLPSEQSKRLIIKDISQVGIRFLAHDFIPKDKLLEIRLDIEKIHFSFKAIVKTKWFSKEQGGERYEIGAEFVNIPQKAADHLIDYIKLAMKS